MVLRSSWTLIQLIDCSKMGLSVAARCFRGACELASHDKNPAWLDGGLEGENRIRVGVFGLRDRAWAGQFMVQPKCLAITNTYTA
jgi:hypothetical protein